MINFSGGVDILAPMKYILHDKSSVVIIMLSTLLLLHVYSNRMQG